ncbi:MAG: ATP-dependent helicase, partial [Wujia sp.]
LAMPANNICVVGDDDQSVYGFRGARPEIMQQFKRDFAEAEEIILGRNYRCDRWITECSAAVIEGNKNRFKKRLVSESSQNGVVKVISPRDSGEENDMIVNMIRKKHSEGMSYENQAILYRTNIQPRRLVYRLNQNNIPYTISDTLPNIFEHFAVKNVLDYMYIACGDWSRARFLRIINKPSRYISRELLQENPVDIDKLRYRLRNKDYIVERLDKLYADIRMLSKLKPYAACNFIRRFIGYDDYLKEYSEYTQLDVQEFYEVLDEFSSMLTDMNSYSELFDFIKEYTELLGKQKETSKEHKGVRLMTMHGAKGLEFECVYIMDAVEGIVPYKKSKSSAELEEERRMFYVAMTRAKHELYIFTPGNTNGKDREVSRYVKDIENYLLNKDNFAK